METILYILAKVVDIYLSLCSLALLLRVILPLFSDEDNVVLRLSIMVSEPIILPFRLLLSRFEFVQNSPFDVPFFVGYIALSVGRLFLPII
ncbi:MAG: YggT family protein [Clostridia bacterium]|nr:YggT family protein [Clostridia bacterium]